MPAHPVEAKLRTDVLPYLISARLLRRQWFYRLHVLFGYTTDGLAALTTVGLVPAAASMLFGAAPGGSAEGGQRAAFASLADGLPTLLSALLAGVLVGWICLRLVFDRENGQKRAVLARNCSQVMRQANARLHRILALEEPMSELNKLILEQLNPTVDRNIQEDAWPWTPFAPSIDRELEAECKELCDKYASGWRAISNPETRAAA